MLENDPQLNTLLDRLENGENLGAGLQKFVDEKLDRIEYLMGRLGLLEPEDDEEFFEETPVVSNKKANSMKICCLNRRYRRQLGDNQ